MEDYISIFVESNEKIGILYDGYKNLLPKTEAFLSCINDFIDKLNENPEDISSSLSDDITTFRKAALAKIDPKPIELNKIKSLTKQIKEFQTRCEDLLKKYIKAKDKLAYGGNYFRSVIKKPKVYVKDPNPETYSKVNQHIREANRGMDWVEKVIMDLYNMADQDLNIIEIIDRVYKKQHIFESKDYAVIEDVADNVFGMLPESMLPYNSNTTDKKTGGVAPYIKNAHDMATFGEEEPEKELDIDDYKRPGAEKEPEKEDIQKTPDEETPGSEPYKDPEVVPTKKLTSEEDLDKPMNGGSGTNYYYYTYNNSLNRNQDDHSVHTDDHSVNNISGSYNNNSDKEDKQFRGVESANPWELNLGIDELILEAGPVTTDGKSEYDKVKELLKRAPKPSDLKYPDTITLIFDAGKKDGNKDDFIRNSVDVRIGRVYDDAGQIVKVHPEKEIPLSIYYLNGILDQHNEINCKYTIDIQKPLKDLIRSACEEQDKEYSDNILDDIRKYNVVAKYCYLKRNGQIGFTFDTDLDPEHGFGVNVDAPTLETTHGDDSVGFESVMTEGLFDIFKKKPKVQEPLSHLGKAELHMAEKKYGRKLAELTQSLPDTINIACLDKTSSTTYSDDQTYLQLKLSCMVEEIPGQYKKDDVIREYPLSVAYINSHLGLIEPGKFLLTPHDLISDALFDAIKKKAAATNNTLVDETKLMPNIRKFAVTGNYYELHYPGIILLRFKTNMDNFGILLRFDTINMTIKSEIGVDIGRDNIKPANDREERKIQLDEATKVAEEVVSKFREKYPTGFGVYIDDTDKEDFLDGESTCFIIAGDLTEFKGYNSDADRDKFEEVPELILNELNKVAANNELLTGEFDMDGNYDDFYIYYELPFQTTNTTESTDNITESKSPEKDTIKRVFKKIKNNVKSYYKEMRSKLKDAAKEEKKNPVDANFKSYWRLYTYPSIGNPRESFMTMTKRNIKKALTNDSGIYLWTQIIVESPYALDQLEYTAAVDSALHIIGNVFKKDSTTHTDGKEETSNAFVKSMEPRIDSVRDLIGKSEEDSFGIVFSNTTHVWHMDFKNKINSAIVLEGVDPEELKIFIGSTDDDELALSEAALFPGGVEYSGDPVKGKVRADEFDRITKELENIDAEENDLNKKLDDKTINGDERVKCEEKLRVLRSKHFSLMDRRRNILNGNLDKELGISESVMTEEVGDADDGRPKSDHPIKDILLDVDRTTAKAQQKAKKAAQDVINVGKAAMKPINRTKSWINGMISKFKDANETNIKEKMADPYARKGLFNAIRKAVTAGALLKAGILLNPVFLFLAVSLKVSNNSKEFRIRNEMITELKNEMDIVQMKIDSATNPSDKAKLMRFKNELNKKLLRVGGGKKWAKII